MSDSDLSVGSARCLVTGFAAVRVSDAALVGTVLIGPVTLAAEGVEMIPALSSVERFKSSGLLEPLLIGEPESLQDGRGVLGDGAALFGVDGAAGVI
ncbi:hypothetical protein CKO15_13875, partial [Halorhodospira abdelmalekii]|uniref:hypothetical protein n=1 Tax=Halorhodospira abdelmalekii TaxID=421629 RepID=UPI0019064CE6